MGNVTLAAIKIGHVMFGLSPLETITIAGYTRSVRLADKFSTMGNGSGK